MFSDDGSGSCWRQSSSAVRLVSGFCRISSGKSTDFARDAGQRSRLVSGQGSSALMMAAAETPTRPRARGLGPRSPGLGPRAPGPGPRAPGPGRRAPGNGSRAPGTGPGSRALGPPGTGLRGPGPARPWASGPCGPAASGASGPRAPGCWGGGAAVAR